ncbi:MAG: DUF4157 domain-containing protein [Lachnospiraceae bacterium]
MAQENTDKSIQLQKAHESMSGLSFDDVRIPYSSSEPAKLGTLAYTEGSKVFVGPGQEKHLSHELGHVLPQKQGRVAAKKIYNPE